MELSRLCPVVAVLSGPSGVGKDAILTRMRDLGSPFHFTVTATTRPRRENELNGHHYHFITLQQFQNMREQGQFLEWAEVYGHFYGVPREPVKAALTRGLDVIMKVDVQGAATIRALLPQAVFIFLAPASLDELESRLGQRRTESAQALEVRLRTAREEMKQLAMFDYVVINAQGQMDRAVAQVQAIITAEKCRVVSRKVEL